MSSQRAFYFPDSTRPTFQIHFDEKTHWETWPELPHLDASMERWGNHDLPSVIAWCGSGGW